MRNIYKGKCKLALIIICMVVVASGLAYGFIYNNIDRNKLVENLQEINDECNKVYENVEESEEKYIRLLENEKDSFKIGMYSSALVQVYTSQNDYDKVVEYGKKAIENYKQINGGEYYAIEECKNLAWGMLRMGMYADSFNSTNDLIEMLDSSGKRVLTEEERVEAESLVYAILLAIYSEFEIMDKAQVYYNKLCNLEVSTELEVSKQDRISYSKMIYAHKLKDIDLIKKYSDECYEIGLKRDKETGSNTANSVIINVALADIALGRYNESLESIKLAEDFYTDIKYYSGLTHVYTTYSKYYEMIGNVQVADEYYKKAIHNESEFNGDLKLLDTIRDYILFLRKNNLDENKGIEKFYEEFYELIEKSGGNKGLNQLLTNILNTNENLTDSRLVYLENKSKESKVKVILATSLIIILAVMILRMGSLIKKKNETEKKLKEIANTDYLTLVNTRENGYKLTLELVNQNREFSLAIIDIDNFKCINDKYGHIFGDLILKTLADIFKERLESEDIIIRFGGEEFIIVFVDTDKKDAKNKLDKIREEVYKITFDNNVRISFSSGIEQWDYTELDKVIEKADILLYEAKKQGKNRVLIEGDL